MKRAWLARLALLVPAAALFYLVLSVVSFWPDGYWAFETLSNLRVIFVSAGILSAGLMLFLHYRMGATIVACGAVLHAIAAMHALDLHAARATAPVNLRVMSINIGFDSRHSPLFDTRRDAARLIEIAKAENPDVLVLMEDRQHVREALAAEIGDYPYRMWTGVDYRSISVHSRYPLLDWRVRSTDYLAHIVTGTLYVPTAKGERKVLFIATHPPSPTKSLEAAQRRKALARLMKVASESRQPVILAGDLNLTAHSAFFERLLHAGNLRDTALGRAPAATWKVPVFGPFGMGLRIDHVLVSPHIAVAARRVGPDFRSDHRPLTVDLVVPADEHE